MLGFMGFSRVYCMRMNISLNRKVMMSSEVKSSTVRKGKGGNSYVVAILPPTICK